MSRVATYLNFRNNTEEAFLFYKSVFGGEFDGDGIVRYSEMPPSDNMPPISESDKKLVMHVALPIFGGSHVLMGSDVLSVFGEVKPGNTMHVSLSPDTREETKQLFDLLSKGGQVTMDLQDTFWGAYYGSCIDQFGVQWMVNFESPK